MTPDKSFLDDFGIFSLIQPAKYEPPSRATWRKYDWKCAGLQKGISELNFSLSLSPLSLSLSFFQVN